MQAIDSTSLSFLIGNTDMTQTIALRNVKPNDFVKRKLDSNKVYRRGTYDKSTKSFELLDCEDMNRSIFVKADKPVVVGFTY